MIVRIRRSSSTHDLLAALYEPGRHRQPDDPHLVDAWDLDQAPDPGRQAHTTVCALAVALDEPVARRARQHGTWRERHVWHCTIRPPRHLLPADDPWWSLIARHTLDATGIAPAGDPGACRWIALRSDGNRLHLVATLVRDDGRSPRNHRDAARAQAALRTLWAAPDADEQAQPAGSSSRLLLRALADHCAERSTSEEEFFAALRAEGLTVSLVTGLDKRVADYALAVPADWYPAADPEPAYPSAAFGEDLTLPTLRRRWPGEAQPQGTGVAAVPLAPAA